MPISQAYKGYIDNANDVADLKKEMEIMYHILYRNREKLDIRQECIEKIQYVIDRINELDNPPIY